MTSKPRGMTPAEQAYQDRIFQQGYRAGVTAGRADLRMVEAALAKSVEVVRFAHHAHAFDDEFCTPDNCSVAEWLESALEGAPHE